VARVAGPACTVFENIEQVPFRHAGVNFHLEGGQAFGRGSGRLLLQMGNTLGVDGQLGVGRKARIDLGGDRRQLLLQLGDEFLPRPRHSESVAVSGQARLACRPRQELVPVVAEVLRASNVDISGLQGVGQMDKNTNLKCPPAENSGEHPALDDEVLPSWRAKIEIEAVLQFIAACMAVPDHGRQSVQQAAILGRRADIHQLEQAKQQIPRVGMDWPKQRQVVVAVPGSYRSASLRQRIDATLLGKEGSDLVPGLGVGFSVLGCFQHPAEDGDQCFFHFPMLILERLELLLCCCLGFSDPSKEHLNQLVAAVRSGLLEQTEKQRMPLARPAHAQKIAHFQGSGFGGELPELGVGNALQHRVWVNEAGQPAEPIRPQSDRLWASRARCLFEAVEARGHDARLDDQQSIQGRDIVRLQSGSDLVVHPRVDLSTQMVRQPLERAEGWQVSGGFAQRLDRSVDQVGRITHRRGRLEHGGRDQLFTGRGVNRDIEIGTHRRTVMVERRLSTGLIQKWRHGGQHELRCQMRHGIAMNVQRCRETTEILAHLQKRRQRQAAGVAPGSGADEGVVGFAQAVADTQFLTRQSFTRTRVGGAVYRCHKVSEKGFAGAAEGDECFEGRRP
jgi:hypothetical protein